MDGIQYNDRDFFQEQQEDDRAWKWPLNLAIGLHIVIFAASIILPDLIERRPLLDNVVTVDLVSMPELATTPPAAVKPVVKAPQPTVKAVDPPPEPEAAEVSIAPKAEVAPEPAAPAKPISLKPLKRKIRKARDTRLAEEKERDQRAKTLKQQALARKKADQAKKRREQARRQQAVDDARQAQQDAEREAAMARQELASVIRSTVPATTSGRSSGSSGRKVQSVVLKQYLSSLYDRVHSYWILPEMRKWDRGLETIVVLTIRRDGSIAHMEIERKSRDQFFDQFVMKTLQSAAPMPSFPTLMSQPTIEVGLRFKPGELAM